MSEFLSHTREVDAIALHNRRPGHDKAYLVWIEIFPGGNAFAVLAGWGRAANPKFQAQNEKGRWTNVNAARRQARELADDKINDGYEDVETYRGPYQFNQILEKATIHAISSKDSGRMVMVAVRPTPVAATAAPQHRSRRMMEH